MVSQSNVEQETLREKTFMDRYIRSDHFTEKTYAECVNVFALESFLPYSTLSYCTY